MNTAAKRLSFLLILFSFAILFQSDVFAQSNNITVKNDSMDITFTDRMIPADALSAITNREGSVELLLTETDLLIQFSNNKLDRLSEEIKKENPDDSHFMAVIHSMVAGGVRTLFNRAMLIPLYEISEIAYNDGKLVIRNQDGTEIFDDLEIDGTPIMHDFSRNDARNFAADAERLLE